MKVALPLLVVGLLGWPAAPAARECGEGKVASGIAPGGDALENFHCSLIGRIYCRMAEDRVAGVTQADAARGAETWLQQYNSTGSHARYDWAPIVHRAAGDVYATKERQPGTIYYRAVYSCGIAQRAADDPAVLQKATAEFDRAADGCEKRHFMRGDDGYPNELLRACLAETVDRLLPRPPAHRPRR